MDEFKVVADKLLIYGYLFIGILVYMIDYYNVINGIGSLALIICGLIVYDFVRFFYKGVVRISFSDINNIILEKYSFFKLVKIELNILKLKYSYKRRISYPNEYYELFLIYNQRVILINSTVFFFNFSESDEKKILEKLEELNIKREE